MYKLYYTPGACSMAVHIVLNEINAQFELKNVAAPKGQPKSPEFLKINPRGAVPVLEFNGVILREGVAILMHLLDSHKNNLLPESGLERTKTLEWLCFANSTLHPAYSRLFFMMKNLGDKMQENELYKPAIAQVQKYWDEIEELLTNNDYITGKKITIADILITVIANWSGYFGSDIKIGTKTKAYFTKIISLPSYKKAIEVEGIKYLA
jgi:glutathione S-transferase